MGTRKSVDQILDKAADILEQHGWVTNECYDDESGGYCALGAIAQAVYPAVPGKQIGDLAYVVDDDDLDYEELTGRKKDKRHVAAVDLLASTIARRKSVVAYSDMVVYRYNDTGKKSAKNVVKTLRRAAAKAREAAA